MITQANNAYEDISHERDSWDPGGYRYQEKTAQNDYNKKLAKMGQNKFNWQLSRRGKPAGLPGRHAGRRVVGVQYGIVH